MKPYTVYNSEGKILRTGTCQESTIALQAGPGETSIEMEADDRIHWVNPVSKQRQDLGNFDITVSGLTITGIPTGTSVRIEGTEYLIDDDVINYTSNRKGIHTLLFRNKAYKDQEVDLEI